MIFCKRALKSHSKHNLQFSFFKKSCLPSAIILGCLLTGLTFLTGCGHADSSEFSAYIEELFREEISSNTLTMHYTLENPLSYGISAYTINLGDCSKESRKSYASGLKSLKKELNRFSHTSLATEDAITYDVLCSYVNTQLELADYSLYEEPLLPSGGVASQFPLLFAQFPLHNAQDISDYLNLLNLVDEYFAQIIEMEQEKAEEGLFMSDAMCQKTLTQLEDFIAKPEENYLITSFENRVMEMDLTDEQKTLYIEENQRIITEKIIPAYKTLISQLTQLMGCGRNNLGLCYFDDGKNYYEALVHAYTGCTDTMEELDERIADARANDFAVCANLIAADPEILEQCDSYDWDYSEDEQILDTLSQTMLEDFPAPPELTCDVCYVDPSMEQYLAPAFYITAPLDDYLNNTIYVNSAANYSDIYYFTTLAHEGFPGHLYQTVMSYEYGLAPIRSILDYPGYTEGWATYVEMISYSYAGLPDGVAELLMHNQSATISLYASSDIGIHYYGWDSEKMYTFWNEYGVSDQTVVKEITDLILADPGNYLKYYVGYLNFLDLRNEMQEKYGDDFSVKAFHEALLRIGPAPFSIIEVYLDEIYRSIS